MTIEFRKQIIKLIVEYLTIAFQCEVIGEETAIEMAKEWVSEQSDTKLFTEYKRLTS